MPVHAISLVAMGLWMLDNCDLEQCATTATELGQWDFRLTVAPVRYAGASGSPVNSIATSDDQAANSAVARVIRYPRHGYRSGQQTLPTVRQAPQFVPPQLSQTR